MNERRSAIILTKCGTETEKHGFELQNPGF